jgi:hypothetical protein
MTLLLLRRWAGALGVLEQGASPSPPQRRPRLGVEVLEDRLAPATFTVSKDLDDGTANTLRWAIQRANATPGANVIDFAIGGGGFKASITLDSTMGPLPPITNAVLLDGYSQDAPFAPPGVPEVELSGNFLVAGDGLTVTTQGAVTIQGLAIDRFNGNGITVSNPLGAAGTTIQGCSIGLDLNGLAAPNKNNGVLLTSADNTVGGLAQSAGNAIAANLQSGIRISGELAVRNVVQGNLIGTGSKGAAAPGNKSDGVLLSENATGNTIGGLTVFSDVGNVIPGNGLHGVDLSGANNNLVAGNLIGVDAGGMLATSNGKNGVRLLNGSSNNTIGGGAGMRNVISGNGGFGVTLSGPNLTGNTISSNYIGVAVDGSTKVANGLAGVNVDQAFGNTVGGTTAGAANVISGNGEDGVVISGASATGNVVSGNKIGTDRTGATAVGNAWHGVRALSDQNTIGGTTANEPNLISENGLSGVNLGGNSNLVLGNFIGTNAAGTAAIPNKVGVVIRGNQNEVGGTGEGAGNLISGNKEGVHIVGSNNVVDGNLIGTTRDGMAALANEHGGMTLSGHASGNTIGGTDKAARNVISGNGSKGQIGPTGNGIYLRADATGNLIQGNYIGLDKSGGKQLANANNGIYDESFRGGNTIGGAVEGAGNLISGNTNNGIDLNTFNDVVAGNYIGVALDNDGDPTVAIGNGENGVLLYGKATGNTIGGTAVDAQNVIAASKEGYGLYFDGSTGNTIDFDIVGYLPDEVTLKANKLSWRGGTVAGNKFGANITHD